MKWSKKKKEHGTAQEHCGNCFAAIETSIKNGKRHVGVECVASALTQDTRRLSCISRDQKIMRGVKKFSTRNKKSFSACPFSRCF